MSRRPGHGAAARLAGGVTVHSLPDDVKRVLFSVREAFAEVELGGGTGHLEADVIDLYGSEEQRRAARASDFRGPWWALPATVLRVDGSVFSFLDEQGFLYHLPAYLTAGLTEHAGRGLEGRWEPGALAWTVLEVLLFRHAHQRPLPAFTPAQRRALLDFLDLMAHSAPDRTLDDPCWPGEFRSLLAALERG